MYDIEISFLRCYMSGGLVTWIAAVDIYSLFEQRLHDINLPVFRGGVQQSLCLVLAVSIGAVLSRVHCYRVYFVSNIWICFVVGNELRNFGLAILRCQFGRSLIGLVDDVYINTPLKQHLYNVYFPASRCGVQRRPAIAVGGMQNCAVVNKKTGNLDSPIPC